MKRRQFITLLGGAVASFGAAAAWPFTAPAQQPQRVRRIGVLMGLSADDPEGQARLAAFAQGLQEAGWKVGENVRIDYRWGAGNAELMRRHAAELVIRNPDVILAHSSAAVGPLLQETRAVPIVFTLVADPVGAGYVSNLARPGGNVTGFTNFEYSIGGKWLELLKEIAPNVTHVAVLRESFVPSAPASSAPSKRWRNCGAWSCVRSTCAMPTRSSARSPRSPRASTADSSSPAVRRRPCTAS